MSILLIPGIAFSLERAVSQDGIVTWSAVISRTAGSEVKRLGFTRRSDAWAWLTEMARQ